MKHNWSIIHAKWRNYDHSVYIKNDDFIYESVICIGKKVNFQVPPVTIIMYYLLSIICIICYVINMCINIMLKLHDYL